MRRFPSEFVVQPALCLRKIRKFLTPPLLILSMLLVSQSSSMQAETTSSGLHQSISAVSSSSVDQLIVKWIEKGTASPANDIQALSRSGIQIASREPLLTDHKRVQSANAGSFCKIFGTPAQNSSRSALSFQSVEVLHFNSPQDATKALDILAHNPDIEYIEPNHVVRASNRKYSPSAIVSASVAQQGANDPFYNNHQWALKNSGQPTGTNGADIDIERAWPVTEGDNSTIIAVIDSGIDLDHPDLASKVVQGYDFINDDTIPQDDYSLGHGSHVSGIIGAVTNNGEGVAGVCPKCKLMPLKVLDANGNGMASTVAEAICYALNNGADVINTSLGTPQFSITLSDAVDEAYAANIPVVAAMGNQGLNQREYPAAYSNTIAVGFTDNNDNRLYDSNYGTWIDLVAPGELILNTGLDADYVFFSGSSMATPHVAGVIGLIHALNPNLTVTEIRNILRSTADDKVGLPSEDTPGFDSYYGAGRLDAGAAVAAVVEGPIDTPTAEPTETLIPSPTDTPTLVPTNTPTLIPTATLTPTHTATLTPTLASTNTPTLTPTVMLTPTHTATLIPTVTPTLTSTLTPTLVPINTPVLIFTSTITPTQSPAATSIPTATLSFTSTATLTPTVPAPILSTPVLPTPTPTPLPTVTETSSSTSPTLVPTSTPGLPATQLPTGNETPETTTPAVTFVATKRVTALPSSSSSTPTATRITLPSDSATPSPTAASSKTTQTTVTAVPTVSQKDLQPVEGEHVNGDLPTTLYMPFFAR